MKKAKQKLGVPKAWSGKKLLAEIDKHPMIFTGSGIRGKSRAIMYNALKNRNLLPDTPPS